MSLEFNLTVQPEKPVTVRSGLNNYSLYLSGPPLLLWP